MTALSEQPAPGDGRDVRAAAGANRERLCQRSQCRDRAGRASDREPHGQRAVSGSAASWAHHDPQGLSMTISRDADRLIIEISAPCTLLDLAQFLAPVMGGAMPSSSNP